MNCKIQMNMNSCTITFYLFLSICCIFSLLFFSLVLVFVIFRVCLEHFGVLFFSLSFTPFLLVQMENCRHCNYY